MLILIRLVEQDSVEIEDRNDSKWTFRPRFYRLSERMDDEPTKFIPGDTAILAAEEPGRKRFFCQKNRESQTFSGLTHCENCGTLLTGNWCAKCGQPAIDYRRSFRHVIADVLDSFLNWDSKFFATIGLLITRPWRLTNEFLSGKRVRYLHPARLYLLASILFFFAVTYWVKSAHLNPKSLTPEARAEIAANFEKENLTPEQRANVEKALKILPPETASKIEQAIKRKETLAETPKTEDARTKSLKQRSLIAHSRSLIIPIPHRRPTDLRSGLKAAPKKNSANVERTFSCSLSP